MKKLFTIVFTLLVVMHLSDAAALAQKGQGGGKGPGHGQGAAGKVKADKPMKDHKDHGKVKEAKEHKSEGKSERREGTDLQGFKNYGQLTAAQNVSKNLNIPFDQLKARMTGNDSVSLGKAIKELRPDLAETDIEREVKKAEKAKK